MSSLEGIVANGAGGREGRVDDGGPALELVMAVVMEKIGSADGDAGASDFDSREGGMIVDDVVGEENFLAAAAAHVERRGIVQGAGGGDAGEEQVILAIPKAMPAGPGGIGLRVDAGGRTNGLIIRRRFSRGDLC